MNRELAAVVMAIIDVDPTHERPLYIQVYGAIKQGILRGVLKPNQRLPSTRDLASLIKVSRNTVTNAYDQLIAEGYLEARVGAGTYVSNELPEELLRTYYQSTHTQRQPPINRTLSARSKSISALLPVSILQPREATAFRFGLPAIDHFPFHIWAKLTSENYYYPDFKQYDYQNFNSGYEPLLNAIAEYLRVARSVKCDADQIIVTAGSQQAIYLIAQLLLDPGDEVLIEEPGYYNARNAFVVSGAKIVPVPVDNKGFDVKSSAVQQSNARAAFVTPSRQYPLGMTMTLERRIQLIDWAHYNDAWIIEDDYDSEFRYDSRPLASLQGLDVNQRVIYVGTFTKVLFPSLRLGYLVVPKDMIGLFRSLKGSIDNFSPTISQVVLSDFINQGHFGRHIRRMRKLYKQRRDTFLEVAQHRLTDYVDIGPADGGMSVTVELKQSMSDVTIQQEAAKHGLILAAISPLYHSTPQKSGFLVGFTACDEETIINGIRIWLDVIERLQ